MEFRKDIQGLRAIAVLFVFIFHLNADWLPGGFIGVDIFFVLSGYLLTSLVIHQSETNKFSYLNFYKSRIKRIVPAYYFLLLILSVVGIFIFLGLDAKGFRSGLMRSLLFISNQYFASLDTYFGVSSTENPLLHTWTLAVEMQFYFLLPFLLFFLKRKGFFPIILFSTTLLFIYGTVGINAGHKDTMYFSLLARAPEFMIGVIVNLLPVKKETLHKNAFCISLTGIILLLVSAFYIHEESYFPGLLAAIPCIGTGLLLLSPESKINTFLSHKIFSTIGAYSYSVYLWHWPVMAYTRYYYVTYYFTISQILFIILGTCILSVLSYSFIEQPFRKKKEKKSKSVVSFSVLIGLNLLMVFLLIPLNKKAQPIPLEYLGPAMGLDSHGYSFKKVETLGDTLSRTNKILLIGDSHALCMKPYLDYMGKKHSFSFKTITNDTYPLLPNIPLDKFKNPRVYEQYCTLFAYAEKEISENDIIIVQYYNPNEQWLPFLQHLLSDLRPAQHLIVISDFPALDKNPARINRDFLKNTQRPVNYERRHSSSDKTVNLVTSNPQATYIDFSDHPVFDSIPFYKDTLMYYDALHLNIYGSILYAQHTEDRFMRYLHSILLQRDHAHDLRSNLP